MISNWPNRNSRNRRCITIVVVLIALDCIAGAAGAVDVVPNGTFDSDLSSWTHTNQLSSGTRSWDGSIYGAAPGSIRYLTNTGARNDFEGYDVTPLTATINATDSVKLSFYWYKTAVASNAIRNDLVISVILPDGTTEVELWSDTQAPAAGVVLGGTTVGPIDVSNLFTADGAYQLKIYGRLRSGNNASASTQFNVDDIVLDVRASANNPPVIAAGATQVNPASIDPSGSETTTISTTFTDGDQPGVSAFNVTFRVLEPNDVTEVTLVDNQPNGSGGLTITDNGGGSYTAEYTWDPAPGQAQGSYDLYCQVTDGTDTATDGYAANGNELQLTTPNNPPVLAAGVTQISPVQVDRVGTDSTVVSATFTDSDQPGVGAFLVTFKIREPDDATEVTLVGNQPDGSGGLSITDVGGGSYTAQFTYNPDDAQATGFYDLYCQVSDGIGTGTDLFDDNLNELEIIASIMNNPPVIAAGTTSVAPPSVDRLGPATTEFSVPFTDGDQPGAGAFAVTFIAREPITDFQHIIADSLVNGQGGMTVSDDGAGAYTARFDWDPPDGIALGYYDLYASVSDGQSQAVDGFDNNLNDLLITSGGENQPPVVPADNTFASPAALERVGANSTVLSATFTDGDQPGVGAFTVTFKLRTPDNIGEIVLASNAGDGVGGVSISDVGGGIYTAAISWDPPDVQELGLYDLYFDVSDGSASSFDGFENNLDELQIYDAVSNNPPFLTAGNTFALPDTVTRIGSEFTMIKSVFSDADVPGNGAFTVTFKVRDEANAEYTLVDAAKNGEQGIRIRSLTGADYEAAFLWDPPVGQLTGTYDLYFQVTDNNLATVTDNYTDNADELTITATAIAGDGFLLRRNNDAGGCGGTASACHNLADHQSQNCLVCHAPHSTSNIFLIRESIQTPNSGERTVVFKTLGIGDPNNDPDPTVGDPNSGVMADDSNADTTGVCEVCHTTTGHHQNDGTSPGPGHYNAEICSGCHTHDEGFPIPAGGGESAGGAACSCHSSIFTPMNSSTTTYHHQMNGNAADYTISSRTCLMCHVDHNIFRPDLNTGIGQRAKNLRADITSTVTQGDASVLANYDYTSSGAGGICLSCHTSAQTKGYAHPDGSTETVVISKALFDAITGSHNYAVTTTFTKDGSSFSANCVKCHNDEMTKSYQDAGNQFGTHNSDYPRFLDPLGLASPTAPLEEDMCFRCHSTANNPNAGSNQDYYGVQSMTTEALRVQQALGLTYAHPVGTYRGRHSDYAETAGDLADGSTRHAECGDCHSTHAAAQGTHDGSSNLVSNALKGVWGVEPTSWPAVPATSNANTFAAPTGYNRVEPAQKEYQICLKCHSNYTTLPSGARNLAEEINPGYKSTHGIVQPGTNPYCNTSTMNEPWASSKVAYCSDCHRSSNSADPEGPHGSNLEHLLVATIVSDDVNGTPLCMVCHLASVYWTTDSSPSNYPKHPSTQGSHKLPPGCFSCHMWEFATSPAAGINTTNSLSAGNIYVHGMNKRFTINEQDGTAGTDSLSDAFVDGYLENMDFTNRKCWAETCKSHSDKAY